MNQALDPKPIEVPPGLHGGPRVWRTVNLKSNRNFARSQIFETSFYKVASSGPVDLQSKFSIENFELDVSVLWHAYALSGSGNDLFETYQLNLAL